MKKVVTIALLVLIPLSASAQGPWAERREQRPAGGGFLRDLDLKPEQVEKLRELKGGRAEMRDQMQDLRSEREKLMQMVRDRNVSEDQIRSEAKALSGKRAKLENDRIERLLQLRKTLTPDQLNRVLDKIRDKMQERVQGAGADQGAGRGQGLRMWRGEGGE